MRKSPPRISIGKSSIETECLSMIANRFIKLPFKIVSSAAIQVNQRSSVTSKHFPQRCTVARNCRIEIATKRGGVSFLSKPGPLLEAGEAINDERRSARQYCDGQEYDCPTNFYPSSHSQRCLFFEFMSKKKLENSVKWS